MCTFAVAIWELPSSELGAKSCVVLVIMFMYPKRLLLVRLCLSMYLFGGRNAERAHRAWLAALAARVLNSE